MKELLETFAEQKLSPEKQPTLTLGGGFLISPSYAGRRKSHTEGEGQQSSRFSTKTVGPGGQYGPGAWRAGRQSFMITHHKNRQEKQSQNAVRTPQSNETWQTGTKHSEHAVFSGEIPSSV